MAEYTLELLGPIILELRSEFRERLGRMERDIAEIKAQLGDHRDELNVVSGFAMRATGERVAWSGVQAQLRRMNARIDALESRPAT